MTNEQLAFLMRLLSSEIGKAIVECEDELPDDMATHVKNIFDNDRTYYLPTIPLWRIVENIDERVNALEKVVK